MGKIRFSKKNWQRLNAILKEWEDEVNRTGQYPYAHGWLLGTLHFYGGSIESAIDSLVAGLQSLKEHSKVEEPFQGNLK